ncbi:MAG: amidophosphoribosyltransferase [Calditrichia bacterium]
MCGVAGYFSRSKANVTDKVMLALYSEQHRGQESCGIAVSNGKTLQMHKSMGYVKEVFTNDALNQLPGYISIGQVRYPTRGSSIVNNAQPHIIETLSGPIYAIASNGDIVNYEENAEWLRSRGVHLSSNNDGELIGRFLVYHLERQGLTIPQAIRLLMKKVKGAYSALFLTPNSLYVFRDEYGFRPLFIGEVDGDVAVASESCAMDILLPENMREVEPGEIIQITADKVISSPKTQAMFDEAPNPIRHCIFELVYFARPDSSEFDEYVYDVRQKIGSKLAAYDDFDADVVIPVPDSANFIAMGYAAAKRIPFNFGLIRNHYVGRTFIRPDQFQRDESVRQKFNPLKDFLNGKKVVVVDDSIVRGTTIRKIIRMIRNAGAAEVHLRIGSPAVKYPCFYGIDTPNREELIANNMSVEEIRDYVGANSLKYLKIEDLRACVKQPDNFCYACFSGNYPIPKKKRTEATVEEEK